MDLQTVNIVTSVLVFCLTIIVLPLVRYIIVNKDKQVDELKAQIECCRKEHATFDNRVHQLELKVSKLESEVGMANAVHTRLDKLTDRLDTVVKELGSVQTALSLLMKGRLPRSESDFPGKT